jgi:predicted AlkP superfamily pyrophosphatase or phosphodiesterase
MWIRPVTALVVLTLSSLPVQGQAPVAKKVLLIGIDGCRPDAILAAQEAFTLKALIQDGAFSPQTDVLGERPTGAATLTGPGWSSVLTGVWADKHGVKDNLFRDSHFQEYPSFFLRLKQARPKAVTAALVSWKPFGEYVFSGPEGCRLVVDGDKHGYGEGDRQVTQAAEQLLAEQNPDALFVYFGEVDSTGHGYGFHPKAPKYTRSIEIVDSQIERILKALRQRPSYAAEDWLILVCTDHGGKGKEHGLGEKEPEIRTGFLILHGPSVLKGKIAGKTFNVDVAVTALTHLGVPIQAQWKLDGRVVGLKT